MKGSSARVAKDERIAKTAPRPEILQTRRGRSGLLISGMLKWAGLLTYLNEIIGGDDEELSLLDVRRE